MNATEAVKTLQPQDKQEVEVITRGRSGYLSYSLTAFVTAISIQTRAAGLHSILYRLAIAPAPRQANLELSIIVASPSLSHVAWRLVRVGSRAGGAAKNNRKSPM